MFRIAKNNPSNPIAVNQLARDLLGFKTMFRILEVSSLCSLINPATCIKDIRTPKK
jgi:hypothetical protein